MTIANTVPYMFSDSSFHCVLALLLSNIGYLLVGTAMFLRCLKAIATYELGALHLNKPTGIGPKSLKFVQWSYRNLLTVKRITVLCFLSMLNGTILTIITGIVDPQFSFKSTMPVCP